MCDQPSTPSSEGARIANAAQNLLIANQTVNINGKPAWIQDLALDELEQAEQRLHRVSLKHEARAVMPLVAAICLVFTAYGILHVIFTLNGVAVKTNAERLILALPGILVGVPIWIAFYDSRRRHRHVVRAAESRWAEVVVEIALRRPVTDSPRFKRTIIDRRPPSPASNPTGGPQ